MRNAFRTVAVLAFLVACFSAIPAKAQSFDAASVKPASSASGIACSGGPGTSSPGFWRCSSMPLSLVIARAFGFKSFQFSTHDPCCLARFDFDVKIPDGTTQEQFDRMLQNLLRDRFRLAFHFEPKEMSIHELTVGPKGAKLSPAKSPNTSADPWWVVARASLDKDGYPVFAEGHGGLAGPSGDHYRWTAFSVSTQEIARILSDQSGRPVVDATGLTGKYDVDVKWVADSLWQLSDRAKAEIQEQVGDLPDSAAGPTLVHAVQDQLGLKMSSKKGSGEIVVIDHVEKVPTRN